MILRPDRESDIDAIRQLTETAFRTAPHADGTEHLIIDRLRDAGALTLEQSQAAAAVGQIRLARAYEEMLAPHGVTTAQILVTLGDLEERRRYLNAAATLDRLLTLGSGKR